MIISNKDKYSISAMCSFLEIPRSLVYYHVNKEKSYESIDDNITKEIKRIFRTRKNNYGTRKIKQELFKLGYIVSRRRIDKIMGENSLVSNYTVAQFKPTKSKCNESEIANIVSREFNEREELEVCVSDLTYIRVSIIGIIYVQ